MDLQYNQLCKRSLVYDSQLDIQRLFRKFLDKDLCIFDLYKQGCLDIRCCLYILVDIEEVCLYNRVNKSMKANHLSFCIEHMVRKVKVDKDFFELLAWFLELKYRTVIYYYIS